MSACTGTLFGLLFTASGAGEQVTTTAPVAPAISISSVEHIFICCIYSPDPKGNFLLPEALRRVGAVRNGNLWYYTNAVQHKAFVIHLADTAAEMREAFYTEDAHIIVNGHSNYGMGGIFANNGEQFRQKITNLRYVDDDRFLTYSSPWVAINIPKFLMHQSYPNWWPVYKDGTSAIMPYDFNDPHGDPAYNYSVTYQVPGDPTHYKVEAVPRSALQRFPDCGHPAWYSADGRAPDSKNPDERKFFLVNTNAAFQSIGRWHVGMSPPGFYGSNYLSVATGEATNQATWFFSISTAGTYAVSARWPAMADNVTNAQYTVTHAGGTTTVEANQQANGGCWVPLGAFKFDAGKYAVVLTDKTAGGGGNVIADAIQVIGATNTSAVEQVIDNESCPKTHFGKKTVVARKEPGLDPEKFRYQRLFYEGCLSGTYYLDVFHRGVAFYTLADSYLSSLETYLRCYLQGCDDEQIWEEIQKLEPVFDYYDFSQPPNRQRTAPAGANPPDRISLPVNDNKIRQRAHGSTDGVFDALRQPEFIHNGTLSRGLVLAAFSDRKSEAIQKALAQLSLPLIEKNEESRRSRIRGLIAARRILAAFPEQSVGPLLELYAHSDSLTRGSIIRAAGEIPDDVAVKKLLLGALADESVCEGPEWNSGGELMRVCDAAYNQLVLRYKVQGVLHTIGQTLAIDDRRYHIERLKENLAAH